MADRDWIIEHMGTEAFERLAAGLSGSELQSVLLEVMRRRAIVRPPREVLAQYQRDAFCLPASVDQRASVEVDHHLLAAVADFEALELSPVAPLGCCTAVALTDQNRVLSTLRTSEVVSDPTNVLALECAARMRTHPDVAVHLATSQRVIRAQPVPKLPGYAQHFRIFVLASGGRESKDHAFTVETLTRHIRAMHTALDRLERHGFSFGARRVELLAVPDRAALADRVAEAIGPHTVRKPLEHPYYSGGIRFQIWVTDAQGETVPLIDGGTFDWLATLTSNRRAVYVATGAGAQLIPLRFRLAPA